MKLQALIQKLEAHPASTVIKSNAGLIQTLKELDQMIGLSTIKEDIADQTAYLLSELKRGKRSKAMLNTVLAGPPGVGKTSVGIKMAQIWYHMGYLDHVEQDTWMEQLQEKLTDDTNQQWLIVGIYAMFMLGMFLWSGIQKLMDNSYPTWALLTIGAVFLLFVLWVAYYYYYHYQQAPEPVLVSERHQEHQAQVQAIDQPVIEIVSRTDFVAQYLGQTGPKTRSLLRKNRGKVLFIDEAYSLFSDSNDPYGMEALTELNRYMSEHSDEIIVIFAGYKELMQQGIFKAQPGLPRRCMWHFEAPPYNGPELFEIFKQQLIQKELGFNNLATELQTKEFIIANVNYFPSFGGDTERLVHYTAISHATRIGHQDARIEILDIERGMQRLRQNNIRQDAAPRTLPSANPFVDQFIELIQGAPKQESRKAIEPDDSIIEVMEFN